MGYQQDTSGRPFIAASAIQEGAVVAPLIAASGVAEKVTAAGSAGLGFLLGFALATAASPGNPVSVQMDGVAKAICAPGGSVIAGQLVTAATNGNVAAFTPSAASGGSPRFYVGVARQSAVAGDRFAVHINPGVSL